jgi:4-aminobutyrate aminotransferase-like enzyme
MSAPEAWRPKRVTSELPGPKGAAFHRRADMVLNAGTAGWFLSPVVQAHKEGCLIVDLDGNEFIDGISAWGAEPYGPDHPAVRAAMESAWRSHGVQISLSVPSLPVIDLAERLVSLAPASITRAELSVTGTQAVESTVRLMREATGRPIVLVFGPVYHGESTTLTAAMSSDVAGVADGATSFAPGIVHVPYPNLPGSPLPLNDGEESIDYIEKWLLEYQLSPRQIAGVLIEPIATEGGVTIPGRGFWQRLSSLCDRHGWLLALDEVQTGMGRTGTVFAAERWNLQPDLLILGKGLCAGGAPISAILGSEKAMGASEISLGSTFGWVPAAAAAAIAGIDVLLDGVLAHVQWMEHAALGRLSPLRHLDGVLSVNAAGAEIGVGFASTVPDGRSGVSVNRAVHARMLDAGVLGLGESHKRHYRLQPPLTLPEREWHYALDALSSAVTAELS